MAFKETLEFVIKGSVKDFSDAIKVAKNDLGKLRDAVSDSKSGLFGGMFDTQEQKKARQLAKELISDIDVLIAKEKELTAQQKARLKGKVEQYKATLASAAPSVQDKAAAKEARELSSRAITLRYALYDVSSSTRQAGQAMLGFASALMKAGVAQQAAFSQVEKSTIGESSEAVAELKKQLIDLSTTMPVVFDEVAKVGMLGAQMGVPAEKLESFTKTIIQFGALTGESVDEVAITFGKLGNLLGLSVDQYDELGSAIAKVGNDAASTEKAVYKTSLQIASTAKDAGLASSQVIGLAAALSSTGTAPEEARGVVVALFNEISKSVQTYSDELGYGNERLRIFAEVARTGASAIIEQQKALAATGQELMFSTAEMKLFGEMSSGSAEEFAKQWGDKQNGGAGSVFNSFIKGLSLVNKSDALNKLGLDGTRASRGLKALAGSTDLLYNLMTAADKAGQSGEFLALAYGKVADDIQSKLTVLQNSIQALFAAQFDQPVVMGVLGTMLDIITNTINGFRHLSEVVNSIPILGTINQTAQGVVIGLTAVIGVIALVATSFLVAAGGTLAFRTALSSAAKEGIIAGASFSGLIATMLGMTAAEYAAAGGMRALGFGAMFAAGGVRALFAATGVLLILSLVGAAIVTLGESLGWFGKTAEDTADNPLNDLQKAFLETAKAVSQSEQEVSDFVDELMRVSKEADAVSSSIIAVGKAIQQNGKDFSGSTEAGLANRAAIRAMISTMQDDAKTNQKLLYENLIAFKTSLVTSGILTAEAAKEASILIDEVANRLDKTNAGMGEGTKANTDLVVTGFNSVSSSAGRAKTAVEKLTDALDKAFAKWNKTFDVQSAFDSLGESIAQNGKAVNLFTKEGRSNFSAIKDVIYSLKDQFAGNPKSLANKLAAVRAAMIKMGITSKLAFAMVDAAMKTTGKKGKALAADIAAIFGQINGAMVEEIADSKGLRTITDYVSDLGSVLQDALTNRYAKQSSEDSISSAWLTIKESADAAKKSIDDANLSINEMKADKSMLEYQLQVAIRYGDTVRADAIQAKLDKLNSSIAEEQQKIADAQEEANKSLTGNSKAAIENRSKVRDLVQKYNEYLLSLAQTGMSTEDLKVEAAKLADEFLTQGESMGFAKDELLVYTDAFKNDFTTVVDNLPKDVTLNVVTDPALQAVIDFVKSTNEELAKILSKTIDVTVPGVTAPVDAGIGAGNPGNGGSTPTTPTTPAKPVDSPAMKADKAQSKALATQIKNLQIEAGNLKNKLAAAEYLFYNGVNPSAAQLAKINGFKYAIGQVGQSVAMLGVQKSKLDAKIAKGGYAAGGLVRGPGSGTSDSINTNVSNGEYVLRANAVKYYGTDFMNALNQMQIQRPAAGSSAVGGGVVYLSPDDRALLRAAIDRPISLYTENTTIAKSANAGNVILAQRGLN